VVDEEGFEGEGSGKEIGSGGEGKGIVACGRRGKRSGIDLSVADSRGVVERYGSSRD